MKRVQEWPLGCLAKNLFWLFSHKYVIHCKHIWRARPSGPYQSFLGSPLWVTLFSHGIVLITASLSFIIGNQLVKCNWNGWETTLSMLPSFFFIHFLMTKMTKMLRDSSFRSSVLPEFPGDCVRREQERPKFSRRQLDFWAPSFNPTLGRVMFLGNTPLICCFWAARNKMHSKRVRLSKMINLHALVLRPSLLPTALTMSYCQLSWGREQQFSYNAAFTISQPAGRANKNAVFLPNSIFSSMHP